MNVAMKSVRLNVSPRNHGASQALATRLIVFNGL
jgi:hypothetical protein